MEWLNITWFVLNSFSRSKWRQAQEEEEEEEKYILIIKVRIIRREKLKNVQYLTRFLQI